jgi:hypothetical protein
VIGRPSQRPRSVVASSSFELARPIAKGEIELVVRTHEIADGQWIAQAAWIRREGSMPMAAAPLRGACLASPLAAKPSTTPCAAPCGKSPRSASPHRTAPHLWISPSVPSRSSMSARAMRACAARRDGRRPVCRRLRGVGMGLASLGATVELACETDPGAQAVYRQRAAESHARGTSARWTERSCAATS